MNTENEIWNIRIREITKPLYVKVSLYLMIFSYFYNLPVINYSIKGSNEFRLYDIVGLVIIFIYANNYNALNYFINNLKHYKALKTFITWCLITIMLTAIYNIILGSILSIIQTLLYFFHLVTFFLTAVILSILLLKEKECKRVLHFVMILIILSSLVVVLQNIGVIPFLWSYLYAIAYDGFLSGTFGPNKIVLGMTMFMSFTLCFAFFFQKKIKLNKIILIGALIMSAVSLLISGSRTSYLAFLIFIGYIFLTRTIKLLKFSFFAIVIIFILNIFDFQIVSIIGDVFENRIIGKLTNPVFVETNTTDVDLLYQDLGAGRKGLSLEYIKFLLDTPLVIPFGMGFNNRAIMGFSAHNIYLTLIAEVGVVGSLFYFKWLFSYLFVKFGKSIHFKLILQGLILAMLITLFFGEHLYIYRPLFGILGFFLLITALLIAPRYYYKNDK